MAPLIIREETWLHLLENGSKFSYTPYSLLKNAVMLLLALFCVLTSVSGMAFKKVAVPCSYTHTHTHTHTHITRARAALQYFFTTFLHYVFHLFLFIRQMKPRLLQYDQSIDCHIGYFLHDTRNLLYDIRTIRYKNLV